MTANRMIKSRLYLICWLLILVTISPVGIAAAKPKNVKPVAVAGSSQSVLVNTTVTLDGSKSLDSDGLVKKWQWTQTKGTKVKLSNAKKAVASFTSPKLKAKTTSTLLSFKLTITDDRKATASSNVIITVKALPVCKLPEVLQNGSCTIPAPICVLPKILLNGECYSPVPTCTASQILQNGACVELKAACPPPKLFLNGLCANPIEICKAPQFFKQGKCVTPEKACDLPLVLQNGNCVPPGTSTPINDTGIIECSNGDINSDGCGLAHFPKQDAETGRDITHYNDSDGAAGFSFTKISASGAALPINANEWSCIKDNVTGLLWENKTNDAGLHDKNRNFSYYSPESNPKNLYNTVNDANGFINAVNAQGLCGINNWRLPSSIELQGIVNFAYPLPGPAIDQNFFPNTVNSAFWSSSPFARDPNSAWILHFDDGRIFEDFRNRDGGASIRLVSGVNNPHAFVISNDGHEVTDNSTGLTWQRCVVGMQWNGSTCAGFPRGYMYSESLQLAESIRVESGVNWRLPNIKELSSIVDTRNIGVTIDESVFPNSPHDQYWSSSPFSNDAFFAWMVSFFQGSVYYSYTEDLGMVRLVKDKD
jgi:hypothetical protein